MKKSISVLLGISLLLVLGFSYAQGNVQVKKWAVITSAASNIRSMPSKSGEIIHVAKRGDRLEVLEDLGIWLRVKLPDGRVGFVRSGEVRVEVEKVIVQAPAQAKPPQPTYTPPSSGAKPTVSKKRSLLPLYIAGGAALAGGAAYLLFRKGGLLNRGTATLKVNSTPSPADFYLDDEKKCETPCTVENVPPGKHKLRVVRELYGEWSKEMELKGYQEYDIEANLSPYEYDFDFCFGSHGSGNGQFDEPWDITIDQDGNMYVTDAHNDRVQKFTSSGNYVDQRNIPNMPSGIDYSSYNNSIYVVRNYSSYLRKYTLSLSFSWTKYLGLRYPRGLGVDSSGNVYIADSDNNRIVKTDADGNYITDWTIAGGPSWPMDAEPASNGNVYVSLCWTDKVAIYSSSGTKQGEFSRFVDCPSRIEVDRMGHVYVTSLDGHKVYKFTEDGDFILSFGSYGSGNGQFYKPSGIAVYENGDLAIVDEGNDRICIWRLSNSTASPASARIKVRRKRNPYFRGNGRITGGRRIPPVNRPHRPRRIRK